MCKIKKKHKIHKGPLCVHGSVMFVLSNVVRSCQNNIYQGTFHTIPVVCGVEEEYQDFDSGHDELN